MKNEEENSADMILYGTIGSDEWWDDICDKTFKEDIIKLYKKTSDYNLKNRIIFFMSLVGDVFEEEFKLLTNNLKKQKIFLDNIGYFLPTSSNTKSEIKKIINEISNNEQRINTLSQSIWISNRIIEDFSTKELKNYFKISIQALETYINIKINKI